MQNISNQKWFMLSILGSVAFLLTLSFFIPMEFIGIYIKGYSVLAVLGNIFLFSNYYKNTKKELDNTYYDNKSLLDQKHIYKSYEKAIQRSQAVIEFTPDGIILNANENFCNTVGYSLSEIQGKHHRIFVDKNYAQSQEYKDFWNKLASGQFMQAEYQRFGKNNKEIWLQASYNPIFDENGKVQKIVKYATDITEQKKRNMYYTSQIQALNNSQAVIEFTLDGIIVNANENFCNTVGYSLLEIKGQHHRIFVDKNYVQSQEYKNFWNKLASGQFMQAEYQRFGKNQKEVWIQASYNPIFDVNGDVISVVKYATDITETVKSRRENNDIIQKAISTIDKISCNILTGAEELAKRNDKQAVGIEETSASIEEIATSITDTSHAAEDVSHLASDALEQAEENKEIMNQAIHAMEMLEKNAEKIDNIVGVIDTIASQTNLLALNAAVEAARAGEAGKGFAVVAAEVRSLASQCSDAASDIKQVISTSNEKISDSVSLVRNSGKALTRIVSSVEDVSRNISNISCTSQEQSINIQEISKAISEIDSLTQKNSYLSDESTASAKLLSNELSNLLMLLEKMEEQDSQKLLDKKAA